MCPDAGSYGETPQQPSTCSDKTQTAAKLVSFWQGSTYPFSHPFCAPPPLARADAIRWSWE